MAICIKHKIAINEKLLMCEDCFEEAALRLQANMGMPECYYCGYCGARFLDAKELADHLPCECESC